MPIVFARVDDRLIHGQIVQAWLPQLNVDEVIIPRTKRNQHTLNGGLLRLSLPYEYELSIMEAPKIAAYVASSKRRIFLLMDSLQDFTDLLTDGVKINSVNIGGMHFKEGAQKLADNVFLDKADKHALKLIYDLGIGIETRAVPNASSIPVTEVLRDS
ncbi:MAG: PTS sugar transporter subunit IIB [Elusimicrobiaceae bacterium]|nr:PTS sugar transporter subunit IIB [Elusimicrobiaceae bacterium]